MRVTPGLVDALTAAVREVLRLQPPPPGGGGAGPRPPPPADAVLSSFFRTHPKLGQHDRGFIAETVYALLRRKRLVELAVAGTGPAAPDARARALAAAVRVRGFNLRELAGALRFGEAEWLEAVKGAARGPLPLGVECDLPDWLIARLAPALGEGELVRLAGALNQPAPLDLRGNTLKAERGRGGGGRAAGGGGG